MLAGWIASGRIRYSPELIHSASIAWLSSCEGSTPAAAAPPAAPTAPSPAVAASLIRQRLCGA